MKLKTRLIISFCIILFVPLLLGAGALKLYHVIASTADDSYSIEGNYAYLTNSLQELNQHANRVYTKVKAWIEDDYDRALNPEELKSFNAEIREEAYSYLIVREGNRIIFDGAGDTDVPVSRKELPLYGANKSTTNVVVYVDSRQPALIRQFDFRNDNDIYCTAFLVTSSQSLLPETKRMFVDIVLSILLILVLTAILLIGWTYRSIVPRLRTLIRAADEIREGTLNHPLDVSGTDEISELFRAFEDMRKRLYANAKEKMQNEEEQRQLISNIAHDLKTPITAIRGYSEGLLDGVASTPEKKEAYLRTIQNKAEEMNSLINELTLYSKIDTNRIPYNFQTLNVSDFFMDCAEEIGMDLENQKIEFSYYNYTSEDTKIIADPEQLARVIHNIVGNSVKYRGDAPLIINLRVRDVGDAIQVEIEDNGRGIAEKDMPYIFDRMYRADSSRNSRIGGSGIGLSIVKKIIEDHGGRIWATSRENVGTTMYFVIQKSREDSNGKDTDR